MLRIDLPARAFGTVIVSNTHSQGACGGGSLDGSLFGNIIWHLQGYFQLRKFALASISFSVFPQAFPCAGWMSSCNKVLFGCMC